MNIYVVTQGERGQGGSIVDIFYLKTDAVKFATKFAKTMSFSMVKQKGRNAWNGGCDWLSVAEWPVSDSAEESLAEINN